MIPLMKCYHHVFDEKYKSMGFYKKGKVFARLNGDVVQSFSLKKYSGVPHCVIEFGVTPLCYYPPLDLDGGLFESDQFYVEDLHCRGLWWYEPLSVSSIIETMQSLSETVDKYIIPFFDKCFDCGSTFDQLHKLEVLFENNRLKSLEISGSSDKAQPFDERILFDDRLYFFALKSENWSFAKGHLEAFYKSYSNTSQNSNNDNDKLRFKEAADEKMDLLQHLYDEDYTFFRKMVENNEKENLEHIKRVYPRFLRQL